MKPTQLTYNNIIKEGWQGYTAKEICDKTNKKLSTAVYNNLNELANELGYEIYYAQCGQYSRKAYRVKLPKFEFGIIGIMLLIIIWKRQGWISIEELNALISNKVCTNIEEIVIKLEDLKDSNFIIEDKKDQFFYRIRKLDASN